MKIEFLAHTKSKKTEFKFSGCVKSLEKWPRLHLTNGLPYLLTPLSRVFLENITGSQLLKKFPAFSGTPKHSQVPTTCSYPEPDRSSPYSHTSLPKRSILILSSHLHVSLPSGFFPSCFRTKTLYTPLVSPILATYPAHLILLDLIIRTIMVEQYRS
jgi:hypothetical protein